MSAFKIRRPVSAAISWTILAELIRRHGRLGDLRVIEMHPGGGMYDLLVLARVDPLRGRVYDPFERVGSINLLSGTLRGADESSNGVEIIDAWFRNEDPKDTVAIAERELGFAPRAGIAASNRWTFGPRLFASLLGSRMTRREYLDARMCFADTSGYGAGIDPKFARFEAISRIDRKGVPADDNDERAALCWFLMIGPEQELAGVYRMDGLLSPARDPGEVNDLFARYREIGSLSEVTAAGAKLLGI